MWFRTAPLLLLLCAPAPAGAAAPPIQSYTVAEGLAHYHVSKIYRDSHGYLWICTDEGLSRFDGHRFVNFTVAEGLPHIHVNDIVESRAGNYWIATDGGVTLYRPAHKTAPRFVTFKPEGPPDALFVNAVLEETGGSVLVGTAVGLYRLRLNSSGAAGFERIDFKPPPDLPNGPAVNTPLIAGEA